MNPKNVLLFSFLIIGFYSNLSKAAANKKDISEASGASPFVLTDKSISEARKDPAFAGLISGAFADSVRHGLDMTMHKQIEESPVAQAVQVNLQSEITAYIQQMRTSNLVNMTRAVGGKDGQHQDILQIVRETATQLGFSQAAINNQQVFVSGDSSINAYTYSPDIGYPDMVILEGLRDLMSDQQGRPLKGPIKAVVGHELGHVIAGHTMTAMVIQTIFNATGKIIIPPDEAEAFKKLWVEHSRILLQSSLCSATCGDHNENANLVNALLKISDSIGEKFAKSKNREALTRLGAQLVQIANDPMSSTSLNATDESNADDNPILKMMKAKELKKAMVRVTQSQEITADRIGSLVAGFDNLAEAMAKLAGGKKANGRATIIQVNQLLESIQSPSQLTALGLEPGDHPTVAFRTAAYRAFEKSINYEMSRDAFGRGLFLYFTLSDKLNNADKILSSNSVNLSTAHFTQINRDRYSSLAMKLSAALVGDIMADFSKSLAAGKSPELFNRFVKTMDRMSESPKPFSSLVRQADLGRRDRIMLNLWQQLKVIKDPVGAQAADVIRALGMKLGVIIGDDAVSTDALNAEFAKRAPIKITCEQAL